MNNFFGMDPRKFSAIDNVENIYCKEYARLRDGEFTDEELLKWSIQPYSKIKFRYSSNGIWLDGTLMTWFTSKDNTRLALILNRDNEPNVVYTNNIESYND